MSGISKITLSHLTLAYGKGDPLLDDISFDFESGNLYVIKGPSGSGKTSLLSLLGLIEKPTGGKILYGGKEIPPSARRAFRKDHISFLFQDLLAYASLTGRENLFLPSREKGKEEELAARLGLSSILDKKVSSYSKGEEMRLALARSILEGKEIILLDEPTGNLDSKNKERAYDLLSRYKEGRIIIVVSHDLSFLPEGCVVVEVRGGKLFPIGQGAKGGREAAIQERRSRKLPPLSSFWKIVVDGLRKIPVKSAFLFLVFLLLGLLDSTFMGLGSFSAGDIVEKRAAESGILLTKASSDEAVEKGIAVDQFTVEQGGRSVACNSGFGKEILSFYGRFPTGREVLASEFALSYFGLEEGPALLEGVAVDLVSVPLGETTIDDYRALYGADYERELADDLPFQFGPDFIFSYVQEKGIYPQPSIFSPLLIEFGIEQDDFYPRYFFTSEEESVLLIPTSWIEAGVDDDYLSSHGLPWTYDRELPEGLNLPNPVSFDEVRPSGNSFLDIYLSKAASEMILSFAYEMGLAMNGPTYYYDVALTDGATILGEWDATRMDCFSQEEWGFLKSVANLPFIAVPALVLSLVLSFVAAYLAAYELYRVYFKKAALLNLIGYSSFSVLSLPSLPLLLLSFLPYVLGAVALFPMAAGGIEGFVLSLYGSAPAFSLLGLKWWIVLLGFAVPLLFFLFVPLFFKEGKSFLRLVKKDRE